MSCTETHALHNAPHARLFQKCLHTRRTEVTATVLPKSRHSQRMEAGLNPSNNPGSCLLLCGVHARLIGGRCEGC